MNNELSGLEEGLVGYWNFNSGDGDVLNDQSGQWEQWPDQWCDMD